MMDGTLETIDGRPALRFERRLNHPVERVWRAITEPDELACWFLTAVEWTPEMGETFSARARWARSPTSTRRISSRRTGETSCSASSSSPSPVRCRLVFAHVIDDRKFGAQHAAGWEAHFGRLDALLAGSPKGADEGTETWGEIDERYAEKFGLDPEVGRRALAAYEAGGQDAVLEEMERS